MNNNSPSIQDLVVLISRPMKQWRRKLQSLHGVSPLAYTVCARLLC